MLTLQSEAWTAPRPKVPVWALPLGSVHSRRSQEVLLAARFQPTWEAHSFSRFGNSSKVSSFVLSSCTARCSPRGLSELSRDSIWSSRLLEGAGTSTTTAAVGFLGFALSAAFLVELTSGRKCSSLCYTLSASTATLSFSSGQGATCSRSHPRSTRVTASSGTYVNLTAGLIAGLAVDVPLHPLDTIKTRLQAQQGFRASGGSSSLWKGLGPVIIRSLPCTALFFASYDTCRQGLHRLSVGKDALSPPSWYVDAAAGSVANVVACAVRVPCEVLKQQMQARGVKALTMMSTASHLYARGGLGAFYRGFTTTAGRELTFALVQMPIFEELKRLHPLDPKSGHSSAGTVGMACGGLAGAIAGALTTPLDVAKTQIMLLERPEKGTLGTMREIAATSGVRSLCRGMGTRTAYVGASCALSFGVFEWAKSFLMASS
mmetsp:Transcript_105404/g.187450  ORF Transcript_105404/g.187450 Transcript_105404/m.187450 type:complete len:432 (-) Transcript_105404:141-1436(-)